MDETDTADREFDKGSQTNMRKGFISILLLVLIGAGSVAVSVGALLVAHDAKNAQSRFHSSGLLGTATKSGNFPTSTNTFQDNDIINAGDWNAIESWLGIRNSTDTDSIAYKLQSPTSSDPGHKHSTSAVTGLTTQVWNVGQGGTGTSTTPSDGKMLIGSGGSWKLGTLTASGTNTHVYVGSGTVAISADPTDVTNDYAWTGAHTFAGGVTSTGAVVVSSTLNVLGTATFTGSTIVPTPTLSTQAATKGYVDSGDATAGWWLQSSTTIPAGPVASATVTGITATDQLMFIAQLTVSNGSSQPLLRFNMDTAANYGGTIGGGTSCALAAAGSGVYYLSGIISGQAGIAKVGQFNVTKYAGTSTVAVVTASCVWSNTANTITSINISDSQSAMIGSYMKVYGRN